VLPGEVCPDGAESVCRGDQAHACVGNRIGNGFADCSNSGRVCTDAVATDGTRKAICSTGIPCDEPGTYQRCSGNEWVVCDTGYILTQGNCESEGLECVQLTETEARCR
jgi:hypothetical protein